MTKFERLVLRALAIIINLQFQVSFGKAKEALEVMSDIEKELAS